MAQLPDGGAARNRVRHGFCLGVATQSHLRMGLQRRPALALGALAVRGGAA